jgi:hypothetical protein
VVSVRTLPVAVAGVDDVTSPQTRLIEEKYPGYLTTAQVAELVGRSKGIIERWRKTGRLVPNKTVQMGATTVYLYDATEFSEAQYLARTVRAGRPPKEQP